MAVTITKWGLPIQSLRLENDVAEKLLENLAEALGAHVEFDWADPVPEAGESGHLFVTNDKAEWPEEPNPVEEFYARWDDGTTETIDLLEVARAAIEKLTGREV
jgi:hypothetical protein